MLKGDSWLPLSEGNTYVELNEWISEPGSTRLLCPCTVMVVLEFASVEAIKQCVMLDMGIAVLPLVTVPAELEQGRLVALPWAVGVYRVNPSNSG